MVERLNSWGSEACLTSLASQNSGDSDNIQENVVRGAWIDKMDGGESCGTILKDWKPSYWQCFHWNVALHRRGTDGSNLAAQHSMEMGYRRQVESDGC